MEELIQQSRKEALAILDRLDIKYLIQFQTGNNRISFFKDNKCILIYPLTNLDTSESAIINLWAASKLLSRMKKFRNPTEIDSVTEILLSLVDEVKKMQLIDKQEVE